MATNLESFLKYELVLLFSYCEILDAGSGHGGKYHMWGVWATKSGHGVTEIRRIIDGNP